MQVSQAPGFGIFLKSASRLLTDGWVGVVVSSCRCHFRTIQLGLAILDTKNIGNGPVVEELQPFELGRIPENPAILRCSAPSESYGGDFIILLFRRQKNFNIFCAQVFGALGYSADTYIASHTSKQHCL